MTKISADGPAIAPPVGAFFPIVTNPGGTPANAVTDISLILTYIAANAPADFIDAITEISAALRTGNAGQLVTGSAGADGNLASWGAGGNLGASSLAVPLSDFVGVSDTQTITGKTMTGSANTFSFDLADITLTGTVAQFNAALDSDTFVTGASSNVYTGTQDFGASPSLEIPNGAAPTLNADGQVAVDVTVTGFSHGVLKYFASEEMAVVAVPIAQLVSPADGNVLTYNAAAQEWQLSAGGGPSGGDAWGDTVDASIVPTGAPSTYNLGSAADPFAEVHVDRLFAGAGLILSETAVDPVTPGAGFGMLTISDDLTQELVFTDKGGSRRTVLTSTSGGSLSTATITLADSLFHADASDGGNSKITTVSSFLSDLDIVTLGASQTLTDKTLTNPKVTYTDFNAGTQSSGTYTPLVANGMTQFAVNGGAHALAPQADSGVMLIHYTNNASAGAIDTSAFGVVKGDALTTTNADEFLLTSAVINGKSVLTIQAMQ